MDRKTLFKNEIWSVTTNSQLFTVEFILSEKCNFFFQLQSLSGHTTPVECVKFGQTEDLVCAGSQMGALKIWDLEHAKLARTLTGHKAGIRCMDFHPYGELLTSGSLDTAIKLWDIRRKGCIFTYKGHNQTVNSLKFSPDGQWIASVGEEGMVKVRLLLSSGFKLPCCRFYREIVAVPYENGGGAALEGL